MILSKHNLPSINGERIDLPQQDIFSLPEKVLQFGTGVFIRSFADYFIDKANKKGVFNGRVVVIKSTSNGDSREFDTQDSLYTVCSKGLENGKIKEEISINASISRVLVAGSQWNDILRCAHNPEMKIIISNTTEVGIQLVKEKIGTEAPSSFPGKLLAFLLERYHAFDGSAAHGMVVVPAELIPDNGTKLKQIILELARFNEVEEKVMVWLEEHNRFCNSLVDRIVPGKPAQPELQKIQDALGYTDGLLSVSELFSLWAIEGDEAIKAILSFAQINNGVVIENNIDTYRELKLRLLNGTHTFNCGLAFLAGFNFTRDAMLDKQYGAFAANMMQEEIAAAIPLDIDKEVKSNYAHQVIERFCNPYIDHQWISITAQFTSKMKMRNLPLLKRYVELHGKSPERMTAGFAAYLLFMKPVRVENGRYFGKVNEMEYPINDDAAAWFHDCWQQHDVPGVVNAVLANVELWGMDLRELNGFADAVLKNLHQMMASGVMQVVNAIENKEMVF